MIPIGMAEQDMDHGDQGIGGQVQIRLPTVYSPTQQDMSTYCHSSCFFCEDC